MGVVFRKTPKGLEEIQHRQGGLNPRIRRLLILVDGQRSVEELRAMVVMDDLSHALGLLEEEGHIEVAGMLQEDGSLGQASDPLPPVHSFRELPPTPATGELERARHFMINTLKTFCGPHVHVSLMHDIFDAPSHAKIREYFGPWYRAIMETRQGGRRADELRVELLTVI
ncbi:hypothetical protein [Azovibrio restrictus]|uniref:hypothetical protein n=1 Tax=Azovibrio restrictus TaxID=146938 RepID=UPI0026ECCAC8|nr:hypothetical protein [Azovibrio restrictus]MDD3483864.1 hypothetical protein [Azovibrio restrictus]